mmetsp:Transcript_52273/g.122463  ORF Transcript_52273/g.122463 Transcript_52273/m.122463 type:complete len:256 (-) Transcript_52273:188-955(-)
MPFHRPLPRDASANALRTWERLVVTWDRMRLATAPSMGLAPCLLTRRTPPYMLYAPPGASCSLSRRTARRTFLTFALPPVSGLAGLAGPCAMARADAADAMERRVRPVDGPRGLGPPPLYDPSTGSTLNRRLRSSNTRWSCAWDLGNIRLDWSSSGSSAYSCKQSAKAASFAAPRPWTSRASYTLSTASVGGSVRSTSLTAACISSRVRLPSLSASNARKRRHIPGGKAANLCRSCSANSSACIAAEGVALSRCL